MSTLIRPEQINRTRHWDFGSGTMKIPCGAAHPAGPVDGDIFYRTDEDKLYIYDGSSWEGIPLPSHSVLSATHGDTLADTVVDGDVLIGNVTPVWSRLAIAIPAAGTTNVLGVDNGELRPSWKSAIADVSGGVGALLRSTAAGDLALHDLTLTNDLLLADGAVVGITGNERIVFDAAGFVVLMGANVGIGTANPGQLLDVSGAVKVTSTAVSELVSSGIFDYAAGGARIMSKGVDASTRGIFVVRVMESDEGNGINVIETQADGDVILAQSAGNVGIGTTSPAITLDVRGATNPAIGVIDTTNNAAWIMLQAYDSDPAGVVFGWGDADAATPRDLRFASYTGYPTTGYSLKMMIEGDTGNVSPGGNKTQDLGLDGTAWDDCWADDFHNEPDYYYMDSRKNRANKIVPVDDLAVICGIKPSGRWDWRTGLPLIDDTSLPNWILTRDKETGETLYGPDGKPWLSQKMTTSLSWGAIRQLDGYRLADEAKIEAIKEQIGILQNQLALLDRTT